MVEKGLKKTRVQEEKERFIINNNLGNGVVCYPGAIQLTIFIIWFGWL